MSEDDKWTIDRAKDLGLIWATVCSAIYLTAFLGVYLYRAPVELPNHQFLGKGAMSIKTGIPITTIEALPSSPNQCPMRWWVHALVVIASPFWSPFVVVIGARLLELFFNFCSVSERIFKFVFDNGTYGRFVRFVFKLFPKGW